MTVPAGAFVTITQTLGGACTVVYNGNMARIDPEDGDALGLEPEVLELEPPADGQVSTDQVWLALRTVHDPEIPVNIVDLGLVYDCTVNDDAVDIEMTLTAPGCGMGPVLVNDVERRVGRVPFVRAVNVNLVFDPPWGPGHDERRGATRTRTVLVSRQPSNVGTPVSDATAHSLDDIRSTFAFFDEWQDKYRFLIDIGPRARRTSRLGQEGRKTSSEDARAKSG